MPPASPVLIVGAGAIGAIVGVHLIRAGQAVHFAETNEEHLAAVRASGLKLVGATEQTVAAHIMPPPAVMGRYSVVLLAVKARHTLDALPFIRGALTDDGFVVSLQNGLEEYKIAEALGNERTVGACLTFGGFYVEPGVINHSGNGSFKIGELDGSRTHRVNSLAAMLEAVQPVEVTDNIFGHLWAKMALGAVYFGTAVTGNRVTEVYASASALSVLEKICSEVVAVADQLRVRIETSDGFDPQAFRLGSFSASERQASWDAQRRYWSSDADGHTGIWRDLAIHRRPTEVDQQLTPIIELADKHGIAVPHLKRLRGAIKEIEAGRAPMGAETLLSIAGSVDV